MSENTTEKTKTESIGKLESLKILFSAGRAYWVMNLINFGDGIAYFGILTLLTRFLGTRVGMTDVHTSMSVSMFTGLVTLFMFFGGFVSDKLGVRKALTWSLFLMLIGRALLTLSPSIPMGNLFSIISLIIIAAGSGVLQPALYAGVKEFTDERTATIGYGILYAIMNLGIVAENFMSPFFRTKAVFLHLGFTDIVGLGWGIDGVFWLCTAVTGFLLLANITLFTKKVEKKEHLVSQKEYHQNNKLSLKERILELPFMDARFMFFIFILIPVRTLFAHQFLTMPDYVFRVFSPEVSSKFEWINGINPFIIVIFVPLFALLTEKVKIINMMIIGTFVTALSTFLLVGSQSVSALLWYVVLFSFGEALWSSRFLEYVADIAPAGRVGAYMGLAQLPWFLAKATTGWYSGFMLETFIPVNGLKTPSTLWLIYAFIALISPISLVLFRKWIMDSKYTKAKNEQ